MNNADKAVHGELKQVGKTCVKDGGLTKREHFAALAMQGLLSDKANMEHAYAHMNSGETMYERIAKQSTAMADALLAELEK